MKTNQKISFLLFSIVAVLEFVSFRYIMLNTSLTNLPIGVLLLGALTLYPVFFAFFVLLRGEALTAQQKHCVTLSVVFYLAFQFCNWNNAIAVVQTSLTMMNQALANVQMLVIGIVAVKLLLVVVAALFAVMEQKPAMQAEYTAVSQETPAENAEARENSDKDAAVSENAEKAQEEEKPVQQEENA